MGALAGLAGVVSTVVLRGHRRGVSLAAGLLVGAVAGLLNGLMVTKMWMPSFIATLATMSVLGGFGPRCQTRATQS